jgi:hypothetical protein
VNPIWFFKILFIRLRQLREKYALIKHRLPGKGKLRKPAFYGAIIGLAYSLLRFSGQAWIPFTLWGAGIGAASLPAKLALQKRNPVKWHWAQAAAVLLLTRILVGIISPYFSILAVLKYGIL